jgi:mannose-6-phosphate isomerase-like protein (cupin superfamily)
MSTPTAPGPAGGLISRHDQRVLLEGPLGALLALPAAAANGRLSIVIHDLAPRALGSPIHTHRNEDEFSYVLEGAVGVHIGNEELQAVVGDSIVKPRGIPHAFWNPTDQPARFLEIITPGGFEEYFAGVAAAFTPDGPDFDALAAVAARFDLAVDFDSIPDLAGRHNLQLG